MRRHVLFALALVGALAWAGDAQACWFKNRHQGSGCWGGGYYAGGGCWGGGQSGGGYSSGWGGNYRADGMYFGGSGYASGQMMYAPGTTIVEQPSTLRAMPSSTATGTGTIIQGSAMLGTAGVTTGGYYTSPGTSHIVPAGYSAPMYGPGYNNGYYPSASFNLGGTRFSSGYYSPSPYYAGSYYGPGYGSGRSGFFGRFR